MIRVMLVDDQVMVRTGFRMILETEPGIAVVGEAVNGREAVECVGRARPDVVLMDVRMPVMDGIEACELICRRDAPPRVMMLTTFDLDDHVRAALRAGASGFLLKDAPPEQLVDAIRIIASGEALLSPSVTQTLIDEIARRPTGQPDSYPGIADLTERELDVVALMAKAMNNREIADALIVGEATVKTHVGRILAKLGARDRAQVVVAAYESGLVSPGD